MRQCGVNEAISIFKSIFQLSRFRGLVALWKREECMCVVLSW